MTQITGQSGCLILKDSKVEFKNWNIYADSGRLTKWDGSFEIRRFDYLNKVFNLHGEINAEFYGDENYYGKIIITDAPINFSDDFIIAYFTMADGEPKKKPQK